MNAVAQANAANASSSSSSSSKVTIFSYLFYCMRYINYSLCYFLCFLPLFYLLGIFSQISCLIIDMFYVLPFMLNLACRDYLQFTNKCFMHVSPFLEYKVKLYVIAFQGQVLLIEYVSNVNFMCFQLEYTHTCFLINFKREHLRVSNFDILDMFLASKFWTFWKHDHFYWVWMGYSIFNHTGGTDLKSFRFSTKTRLKSPGGCPNWEKKQILTQFSSGINQSRISCGRMVFHKNFFTKINLIPSPPHV